MQEACCQPSLAHLEVVELKFERIGMNKTQLKKFNGTEKSMWGNIWNFYCIIKAENKFKELVLLTQLFKNYDDFLFIELEIVCFYIMQMSLPFILLTLINLCLCYFCLCALFCLGATLQCLGLNSWLCSQGSLLVVLKESREEIVLLAKCVLAFFFV